MRIPAFARLRPVLITVLLAAALISGVVAQTEQTPIDIDYREVTRATLPALQFNYPDALTLQVVNTGSPDEFATVRAIPPSQAASLTVDGVQYNLLQFHWHTSSEHEVNGHKYPLEMHFVHQSAGGTLLVVGVFIKPGTSQRELKKIFSHLPQDAESLPDDVADLVEDFGQVAAALALDDHGRCEKLEVEVRHPLVHVLQRLIDRNAEVLLLVGDVEFLRDRLVHFRAHDVHPRSE